jgi:hypothetical protein
MSLRVTVEDMKTGEKGERIVPDGDYILVTSEPCYLDGVQTYAKTHVLTVKGFTGDARAVLRIPDAAPPAPGQEGDETC